VRLALPPRPLRRVLIAPAIILLTAAVLASTPLVVIVLCFAVRFLPGRWRALRLFWFLLVYLLRESLGVVALFALWVLSGFGWGLGRDHFRRAHVLLVGWYLRGLVGSAAKVLGLRLVNEAVPDDLAIRHPLREVPDVGVRPVLVFSRHAGAGDSLILVHLLVNTYGRRPRIVLKDLLQLDPCVDIVLNRLPSRFISPDPAPGAGVVDSIRALAHGLERDGALILFPEGGNFSERRRRDAIERLGRAGLVDAAQAAESLQHVLPPRPGGAFAAIDAAPDADVLFVAHTGLEQLSSVRDLWSGLPMDREVRLSWWTVRADEVPHDPDERARWLTEWWALLDSWIDQRRDPDRSSRPTLADGDGNAGEGR
jgi:1-acyl-sn-glycerol-3-phosphate acyltransferase